MLSCPELLCVNAAKTLPSTEIVTLFGLVIVTMSCFTLILLPNNFFDAASAPNWAKYFIFSPLPSAIRLMLLSCPVNLSFNAGRAVKRENRNY